MSKTNIVPMAQGYMKLECIPDHVGAHWRALVKVTDEQGISIWRDLESGNEFAPDDDEILWTDMTTNIVYKSVDATPFWFEIGVDTMYVAEFEEDHLPSIPIYEWPNIPDSNESKETGIIYWNQWSLSGISDPYLIRFVSLKDGETPKSFEKKNMIGVWGTNSYRTVMNEHTDEESDETEIP